MTKYLVVKFLGQDPKDELMDIVPEDAFKEEVYKQDLIEILKDRPDFKLKEYRLQIFERAND